MKRNCGAWWQVNITIGQSITIGRGDFNDQMGKKMVIMERVHADNDLGQKDEIEKTIIDFVMVFDFAINIYFDKK